MINGMEHTSPVLFGFFACTGLLVLFLALSVWNEKRSSPAAGWLILVLLCVAEILVLYGLSFAGGLSVDSRLLLIDLTYIGWILAPPILLVYVARLTQLDQWLNAAVKAALITGVLVSAFAIFGPGSTQRFFSGGRDPQTFVFDPSAEYWLFAFWSYGIVVTALVLTAVSARRSPRLRRSQVILLYLTLLVPIVLSTVGSLQVTLWGADLAVVSLLVITCAAYGISHFPAFDLRPLTTVEQTLASDRGVVIIDPKGRVTHMNAPAARLLCSDAPPVMGLEIERIWARSPAIAAALRGVDMNGIASTVAGQVGVLTFERSEIVSLSGRYSGTLVLVSSAEETDA